MSTADAKPCQQQQHVGALGREIVMVPVDVVVGEAASAVVERDHAARCGSRRKRGCEPGEVVRVAGQPGQADRREAPVVLRRRPDASVEAKAIGGGEEMRSLVQAAAPVSARFMMKRGALQPERLR